MFTLELLQANMLSRGLTNTQQIMFWNKTWQTSASLSEPDAKYDGRLVAGLDLPRSSKVRVWTSNPRICVNEVCEGKSFAININRAKEANAATRSKALYRKISFTKELKDYPAVDSIVVALKYGDSNVSVKYLAILKENHICCRNRNWQQFLLRQMAGTWSESNRYTARQELDVIRVDLEVWRRIQEFL